ncbi:MAG: hypothetical protein JO187_12200 [Acidobacteria bacterium]|nr:hypothetical protein [Acidobacteriaceae bacterium]MBV9610311.1 hypothetical protein [Acidobacteriota bacterium]
MSIQDHQDERAQGSLLAGEENRMRDLHEQTRTKQDSLCAQVDELVNLKQMEIVRLQKELDALQKVRQVLSTELAPTMTPEKSDDGNGARSNNKLISSVKAALQD